MDPFATSGIVAPFDRRGGVSLTPALVAPPLQAG